MPHFKTSANELYFLTEQDVAKGWVQTLPNDSVQISDAEAAIIKAQAAATIAASILTLEQQKAARSAAYRTEADPLFFMFQRGEATEAEWLAKVAEIKARFPYPSEV